MAETRSPFEAVFSAIDKATAPLQRIARSVGLITDATKSAGESSKHLDKLTNSVKHAGEAAEVAGEHTKHMAHARMFEALTGHVHLLRTRFGELGGTIGEAGHSLSDFLPMLATLGAIGSLTGLVEMVEHTTEAQASLSAVADKIGVTTKQLNALNLAAKLTDVGTDTMQKGFIRLEDSMAKAAQGHNKDVAGLFHHLGISLKDAHGHLRTVTDVLPQLADAFQHTTNPTMRVRMAMALMGRSGADMLPFLTKGSAAMKEFAAESGKIDFTPDKEGMEGLEKFHQSWIELTTAVGGFTTAITTALAPVLTPIIDSMKGWIAANRDWLAATGIEKIKELGTVFGTIGWVLKTVDWSSAFGGLLDLGRAVVAVVTGFRWLNNVFGVVAVSVGAIALVMASPLVGAIGGVLKGLKLLEGAFMFLDGLVMANPIVAAVVGIAVAAFLLYEYWTPITRFFGWVWATIKSAAQAAWIAIKPVRDALGDAASWVMAKFEPLGTFFHGMWDGIAGIFETGWSRIKPIVDALDNAAGFVERHFGLGGVASGAQAAAGPAALVGPQAATLPAALAIPFNYNQISAGLANLPDPRAPLPSLYTPRHNRDPQAETGTINAHITFGNVPPGTKVTTTSSGRVKPPTTSVGYSTPLAGAF